MLEIFALVILFVLAATLACGAIFLAMLPGQIARKRKHPQSEAIAVCGWWGLLTLGLLFPIAFIWAYTNVATCQKEEQA